MKQYRRKIYDLYLANTRHINNWDLVDVSAPVIVGAFLLTRSRKPLYQTGQIEDSLERAQLQCLLLSYFIKNEINFADALKIAESYCRIKKI